MKKLYFFVCVGIVMMLCFGFEDVERKEVTVERAYKMTAATEAGFTDENFYACVVEAAGKTADVTLTDEELAAITKIDCAESGVEDVTGIEKLVGLVDISLNKNKISEVDVSKNVNLNYLILSANRLTKLDVSKNVNLKSLHASDNNLSSIDLSNNKLLEKITLTANNLSSIDVTGLASLKSLVISENLLTALNVKNNSELTTLEADTNKLTSIDLSGNKKLNKLNLFKNNISSINLSNNSSLEELNLSENNLTKLDLSSNLALVKLYVSSNGLTVLDLAKHDKLTALNISLNNFGSVPNLTSQKNLVNLTVDYDMVVGFDFSPYSSLNLLTLVSYRIIPMYSNSNLNGSDRNFVVSNVKNYFLSGSSVNDYVVYKDFNGSTLISDSTITTTNNYYRFRVSGDVTTTNVAFDGNKKLSGYYDLRFITLKSDKYDIDETNSLIDVGGDNDDEIKSNLKFNWKDAVISIEGNSLSVSYNGVVIRKFTLQRVTNPSTGSLVLYVVLAMIAVSVISILLIRRNMFNSEEI